jgi:mono/diheme cytochrome c family protein
LWKEGRRLFGKHGCDICHTTDGKACFGGTLKGLFGTVAILEGGRKMRRDSLYFRRKIAHSATLPLADGMNTMPVYKKALSTRDLHALVAFLRRLTPGATTKKTGKAPKKQ